MLIKISKRDMLNNPVTKNAFNVHTNIGKIKFYLLIDSTTIIVIPNVLFIQLINAPVPQNAKIAAFTLKPKEYNISPNKRPIIAPNDKPNE